MKNVILGTEELRELDTRKPPVIKKAIVCVFNYSVVLLCDTVF